MKGEGGAQGGFAPEVTANFSTVSGIPDNASTTEWRCKGGFRVVKFGLVGGGRRPPSNQRGRLMSRLALLAQRLKSKAQR
jgi:hypothetical protein